MALLLCERSSSMGIWERPRATSALLHDIGEMTDQRRWTQETVGRKMESFYSAPARIAAPTCLFLPETLTLMNKLTPAELRQNARSVSQTRRAV